MTVFNKITTESKTGHIDVLVKKGIISHHRIRYKLVAQKHLAFKRLLTIWTLYRSIRGTKRLLKYLPVDISLMSTQKVAAFAQTLVFNLTRFARCNESPTLLQRLKTI